ncbi:MAG: AAA family ATPase [Owenweeksia sp.]
MFFRTTKSSIKGEKDQVTLESLSWDDWFRWQTVFSVDYIDEKGNNYKLGTIKIGQINMDDDQRVPTLPSDFDSLDSDFFSLGQDVSYYENLNRLGDEIREKVLTGLNDIAFNAELYSRFGRLPITRRSLLRDVTTMSVEGQYRRLALGNSSLSTYDFSYTASSRRDASTPPMTLKFHVEPNSNPPTNIHVLIGRNGVGKTYLLNNMLSSILKDSVSERKTSVTSNSRIDGQIFANLVFVSFSAFDSSDPIPDHTVRKGMRYSYIGLKRKSLSNKKSIVPKSTTILKNEFVKSIESCRKGSKHLRWKKALAELEYDTIFKEADITGIADIKKFKESADKIFGKLSSGHKIVLLTITRLVETVEERSLILIDEPETHLHPPLLSAFIRAVSNLLVQRNGVAIIATHSPVILQEVPKSCVWRLRRSGSNAVAERLETESFGENVGILTREVFGLEVTYSGFHKMLYQQVQELDSYEDVLQSFNNEVGLEGKAILRSLIHNKEE